MSTTTETFTGNLTRAMLTIVAAPGALPMIMRQTAPPNNYASKCAIVAAFRREALVRAVNTMSVTNRQIP